MIRREKIVEHYLVVMAIVIDLATDIRDIVSYLVFARNGIVFNRVS